MKYSSVPLGRLVMISGGGTPSRNNDAYWGGSIPWATVKDLKGTTLFSTQETITPEGLRNSASNLVPAGSVIVATRMGLGKVAINTIDVTINQDLKAFSCGADLEPRYLMYYLLVNASHLDSMGKGATVKGITLDVLKDLSVPLPPLPEQKRITAILDKADSIRRKRQETVRLTEELLRSVFLEMFGDPVTNPKGWATITLCEHTKKIGSGATPSGGDSTYKEFGISLIRSLNVHDGKFVYKNLAHIDDIQASKLANVQVEENDVLLNITGASVARVCRAPKDVLPARVNQHVSIIRPLSNINPIFLEHLLISESMKKCLLQIGGAGATREAITKAQIEELKIICPPIMIQNKYAAQAEVLERMSATTKSVTCELGNLFTSLLQRAFKGEL